MHPNRLSHSEKHPTEPNGEARSAPAQARRKPE